MINPRLILAFLILFIVASFIFVVGAVSVKAQETVIDMSGFQEGDLLVDGFELKGQTRITIHAIGAELRHSEEMYAYGWIINSDTKEPVWVLNEQETRRFGDTPNFREYEGELTLAAGRYECYYYAGRPYSLTDLNINIDNLGDAMSWLGEIVGSDKDEQHRYYSENIEDLLFAIKAPANSFSKFNPVTRMHENAIIDFSEPDDNYSAKKGFTLKKELNLKIVAIGEFSSSDRVFVDFGWIIDANSRKKVWQMDKWNTSWAGGGRKNRGFTGELTLPAGNYVAYFAADDSHSFGEWNVLPPYDPLHYGMIVYTQNSGDMQFVGAYEDSYTEPVIIAMTRMRENEFASKGFTLKKETNLHVVALGEYGYSDEFADHGRIENLDTGEKVWQMTEENTEHAGGAAKNRKFDGVITLPSGNYMVYYVSDDSHSYRNWNATAPLDKEMWGITIFGAGKSFDAKSVAVFDEAPQSGNVLVNLTKVGDDKDVERTFTTSGSQKVHIYALGEGSDGEMYDYGWIENDKTGEVVWEMTYRMTHHAGGAMKNREVDTRITLDRGEYTAHFVTDGSHSFPDFNEAPPDSPQKWGITITKE